MPSQRLEQIQAAIQKLTEAKIVGLTAEIAAAKVLLSVPLPPDLTPQQILDAGQARLDQFGQAVKNQENIAGFAKAANGGIEIATANLQQPDRLAISPEVIDAAIDSALGLSAQAALRLFIDPETGIVIAGRQAGELKSGQQLNLAKLLAEEDGPISQENLAVGIFGRKGKERPGDVRSLVAKLNRGAEDQGLPPVVVNPERKGYSLGSRYLILGIKPAELAVTESPVIAQPNKSKPETFSISQILAMEGQKQQPVAAASSQVDAGKRYLISQVASQTGIPDTAIKVLHQIGALQEGIHFEQRGRVKVYKDEAFPVARLVAHQAKKEDQRRFTERLIRKAVGLPKEKNGENPYGPNGPKTFTVFHEQAILHRLQSCIPVIERRIGKPLQDSFKLELAARLGELTTRLSEDDKLTISSEEQGIIRRQAAATVLKLAKDARSFNFLRGKHQGIEIGLAFIRGLKDQGQAQMIKEFADAIVNPPKKVADTIDRNGLVNGIRTVGPMGDR